MQRERTGIDERSLFNVTKKDIAFFFRIKKSPKIQQHGQVTKKDLSFLARKEIKTPRLTIVSDRDPSFVIIGLASHRRCIESR